MISPHKSNCYSYSLPPPPYPIQTKFWRWKIQNSLERKGWNQIVEGLSLSNNPKIRAYPNSMCRWLQVITWSFQGFIYTKVPALKFKFAKLIALMIFSDRRLWAIHNCLRLALAKSQKYFKKDKLSSFWNSVALLQKYKLRGLKGVYQTTVLVNFFSSYCH